MKLNKVFAAVLALFLLAAPSGVMGQSSYYFWWQVVDEQDRPYSNSAVKCSVYDLVASHTGSTRDKILHTTAEMTSGSAAPLTVNSSGRFQFYTASSTDVRVNCFSDYGGQGQSRISRQTHKIVIPRGFGEKVARFPYVSTQTINSAPVRTGLWLPAGTIIRDVLVYNGSKPQSLASDTVVGTSHLNVGFLGEHTNVMLSNHQYSSIVHKLNLNTDVEFIRPHVQLVTQSSTNGWGRYVVGSHRGVALAVFHTTGNLATTTTPGYYFEQPYVVTAPNGIEITYQAYSPTQASGHVYLMFNLIHVGAFGSPIAP